MAGSNKTETIGESAEVHEKQLTTVSSPHVKKSQTVEHIMYMVVIALLFPTAGAVFYFGWYALLIVLVSIATCLITEYLIKMLRKKPFVMDGSAVVTGLLLALVLPPRIPLWAVLLGAIFAIAIVKEAFGGLGQNLFNPALAGRAFLAVSFAGLMTGWIKPVSSMTADGITSATPLGGGWGLTEVTSAQYWDLFIGNIGGSLGETSVFLLLLGGILLLVTRVIEWRVPFIYIGTVFVFTFILGEDPLFHILAGGLMLGAFFMATDYVTSPLSNKGKMIFALGCGVLTVLIRVYGGMPEGVAFSILIMNGFVPLIDRYVVTRPMGWTRPQKDKKGDPQKEATA